MNLNTDQPQTPDEARRAFAFSLRQVANEAAWVANLAERGELQCRCSPSCPNLAQHAVKVLDDRVGEWFRKAHDVVLMWQILEQR
jgi:hypothetical protein